VAELTARSSLRAAIEQVASRDPVLADLVTRIGPIRHRPRNPEGPFAALVRAIVFQQLAGRAAQAIYGRVRATVSARWRSNVLVGRVEELLRRDEGVLGVQRMRRTERTTVKRLSERCVYVVGMALDVGAIPRPEPFDFRGRPLGELLDVEANVEKRSNGGPTVWDRLSQRRQGLLDVLVLLISRKLLELVPR
jgi:hypothetical protein